MRSLRELAQVERAALWWVENRPAAPDAIRLDLAEALDVLAQQPGIGARCTARHYSDLRRLYLARTRYHLYYRVTEARWWFLRSGMRVVDVGPRSEAVMSNRSIDTDVLSAGFARLLSAGHLRRSTARWGSKSEVYSMLLAYLDERGIDLGSEGTKTLASRARLA